LGPTWSRVLIWVYYVLDSPKHPSRCYSSGLTRSIPDLSSQLGSLARRMR
jgi:hypothetical protein